MKDRHILLKSWLYTVKGAKKDVNIVKEFNKDTKLVIVDIEKELALLKGGPK